MFQTKAERKSFHQSSYSDRIMQKNITVLGIESSCDDTSAAVIRDGVMLSNITAGQKVHEKYGGVVPELASRAHQQNIIPGIHESIKRAGISKNDLHAVAFSNRICGHYNNYFRVFGP